MTLLGAVLLFVLAVSGAIVSARFLRKKKTLRIIFMTLCIVIAAALAVYIGLTAILLDAASNKPPTP